jgi:hypothetical protein
VWILHFDWPSIIEPAAAMGLEHMKQGCRGFGLLAATLVLIARRKANSNALGSDGVTTAQACSSSLRP